MAAVGIVRRNGEFLVVLSMSMMVMLMMMVLLLLVMVMCCSGNGLRRLEVERVMFAQWQTDGSSN